LQYIEYDERGIPSQDTKDISYLPITSVDACDRIAVRKGIIP